MRVAIWGNTFPNFGGIERFVAGYGAALQSRGHHVQGISAGRTQAKATAFPVAYFPIDAVGAHHQNPEALFALSAAIQEITKLLQTFKPDVLHCHLSGFDLFALDRVLRKINCPIVLTVHLGLREPIWKKPNPTFTRILARAQTCTFVSGYLARAAQELPLFAQTTKRVIPNGMPPLALDGIARDPNRVVALGRIVPEKGFDVLVRAAQLLVRDVPEAKVVIYGDGPEREPLIELARSLGLAGAVTLPGWARHDQTHGLLQGAAVAAVPSVWQEPFGLTVLEAAMAQTPVAASAVGAIPDLLHDGDTGLLVPPNDPEALAQALRSLLIKPATARQMGKAARAHVVANFAHGPMVDAYESVLLAAQEA